MGKKIILSLLNLIPIKPKYQKYVTTFESLRKWGPVDSHSDIDYALLLLIMYYKLTLRPKKYKEQRVEKKGSAT